MWEWVKMNLAAETLVNSYWRNCEAKNKKVSPGPLAPPRKIRPRRKMMARSYSFTICTESTATNFILVISCLNV